jgi:hypothetical protein
MASLDPLDRELFQRALDAARSVLKADELDSDEKLEAACVANYSRSLCLTE